MNGLTHVNYLGDKRHAHPTAEGILYITKMDARKQEQQKVAASKSQRQSSDNASLSSQASTISLIKSKFHRRSAKQSQEEQLRQTLRAQINISV